MFNNTRKRLGLKLLGWLILRLLGCAAGYKPRFYLQVARFYIQAALSQMDEEGVE